MSRVLACGGHFWCSGGHANFWVIPLTLATFLGAGLIVLAVAAIRR